MDNNKTYSEYIHSLSKEELANLIIGTNEKPPLLTRNEPTFSRVQIIWAINKIAKKHKALTSIRDVDRYVDDLIALMHGKKWELFYNYDYIRFDLKKPAFYILVLMIWCTLLIIFPLLYEIFNYFYGMF